MTDSPAPTTDGTPPTNRAMSIRLRGTARPAPRVRRSPLLVVAGIVLVIAAALTSVGIYTNLSRTQEVVVVVAPVARGQVIPRSSLATVQVGYDPVLTPVPAADLNSVVGRYAAYDLVPGTFLTPGSVGDQPTPPSGKSEIGVALGVGKYPDDGLMPGDQVMLVGLTESPDPAGPPLIYNATIVTITTPNASNMITVSLLVSESDAPILAAPSAADKLALVLTSREHR